MFRLQLTNYTGDGGFLQMLWDEYEGRYYMTGKNVAKIYKTRQSITRYVRENGFTKVENHELKQHSTNNSQPLLQLYMDGDITATMYLMETRKGYKQREELTEHYKGVKSQLEPIMEHTDELQRLRAVILSKKLSQLIEM